MNTQNAQIKFVPVAEFRRAFDHLFRIVNGDYHSCVNINELRNWRERAERVLKQVQEIDCKRATAKDREWYAEAIEKALRQIEKAAEKISAADNKNAPKNAAPSSTATSITAELIEGTTYYTTEKSGVTYTAYHSHVTKTWQCQSHRKALGRSNPGTWFHYDSLAKLVEDKKAFFGLDKLIEG